MPLTREELGRRIRSARETCGLTQEQLGDITGLSRMAINQIEAGGRSVTSLELDRIAYAVGRDIKAFFEEAFVEQDALAALFRSDAQLANQAELLRALQDSLALGREVTNLEHLLGIDRAQLLAAAYEMPTPRSRWDAIQQGQKVANEERQRLGLGVSPIGDLAELLESQGVRTGLVSLPDNISGLTLSDNKIGMFVVINCDHAVLRRRFSLAHEYAHVLIDRDRFGALSRVENRGDLLEVRANAFAAEFLAPTEGILQFVQAIGKGGASRSQVALFDEADVVQVEQRAVPGSQDIQLYDVVLLSHHFNVSRVSIIYRLRNLKLIDETELQRLLDKERTGNGKALADFLSAGEPTEAKEDRDDFRRRFLGLALETYRREEITRSKFFELAEMVGIKRDGIAVVLVSAGLE
ncbi:MAG TPA: ImmA/IrrE family metallo-endopeptidase [Burkholderiales bacterium]|nr:ImmA/IrrE family metallo-endopeptidase [Burkholderiales bacterium]